MGFVWSSKPWSAISMSFCLLFIWLISICHRNLRGTIMELETLDTLVALPTVRPLALTQNTS